jgi:hypothetical protein
MARLALGAGMEVLAVAIVTNPAAGMTEEELALFGSFGGEANIAPITDFEKMRGSLLQVPGVEKVVPMGVRGALITSGNIIDSTLARLRNAYKARDEGTGGPDIAAQVAAQRDHVHQMVRVLKADQERVVAMLDEKSVNPDEKAAVEKFAPEPSESLEAAEDGTRADIAWRSPGSRSPDVFDAGGSSAGGVASKRSEGCATSIGSEPITGIRTEEIYKTSRLVSNLTGMAVQPNKAIVGANAFAHESGIHQDGVLKNRLTYEIIDARTIGLADNRISLGKLSGRSAFRARLEELGYNLERQDLDDAFARFKELADRKREISDRDLEAIVSEQVQQQAEARFSLKLVQVSTGTNLQPTATVTLIDSEGGERTEASIGTGPVDAVCQALNQLAQVPNELVEFSVKSVTEGIDAMGEVTIRLRRDGVLYSGHAADTDIVVAAAQAFVNALNRLVAGSQRTPLHPQKAPLPVGDLAPAERPRL